MLDLLNTVIQPHWEISAIQLARTLAFALRATFYLDLQQEIFTSFRSPYSLHEFLHLPNSHLAYGNSPASQWVAVESWLGDYVTNDCTMSSFLEGILAGGGGP